MVELKVDFMGTRPTQANPDDAGLDLYAAESKMVVFNEPPVRFRTGTRVAIPDGYVGLVYGRSSLGFNHGVTLANAVGVVDSGFRGEVEVAMTISHGLKIIHEGERIAQLVIMPLPRIALNRVDGFDVTVRNEGGFGSSGR